MNQNFSSDQLIRFCSPHDLEEHNLSKEKVIAELDVIFYNIIQDKFDFNINKIKDYYITPDISNKLILRKLNDNIKRIYKDEQSNRRLIILQIKNLIEETCPMWILKTDLNNFYESIDRLRLISKLQNDAMLSFHSIQLLNKLFNHPALESSLGLPRGLNISATLSEIYMRNFDKWIRRFPDVYYYARFVDDIIVFSNNKKTIEELKGQINSNLEEGLFKKEEKTSIFNGDKVTDLKPLEYLGYKFTTKVYKKKKTLSISIADKKIRKIKSRITFAFLDFLKNNDFYLLEDRIKFLTGNFIVRKNREGHDLKAGIYFNYPQLTDISVLKTLNNYYSSILHSHSNSFGFKISRALDNIQKERLSKYSFKYGFISKVSHSFKPEHMKKIKTCWK